MMMKADATKQKTNKRIKRKFNTRGHPKVVRILFGAFIGKLVPSVAARCLSVDTNQDELPEPLRL